MAAGKASGDGKGKDAASFDHGNGESSPGRVAGVGDIALSGDAENLTEAIFIEQKIFDIDWHGHLSCWRSPAIGVSC